jgi:hypothetical protein
MSDEIGAGAQDDTPRDLSNAGPIWDGPSLFVNRAWIVHNPLWIRIMFAEQGGPDEKAQFRTAVTMSPPDALAFSDKLAEILAPYREWVDTMMRQQTPSGES